MTNSEIAFGLTLESLFEGHTSKKVFFWTFTTLEVLERKEFMRRWDNFVRRIKRLYPGMPWVRVFELHPGLDGDFNGHVT